MVDTLKEKGNNFVKASKKICIVGRKEKIKMVVNLNVKMEEVKGLRVNAMVGRFMGKQVCCLSLK